VTTALNSPPGVRASLTVAELEVLAGLAGVAALPTVLGVRPRDATRTGGVDIPGTGAALRGLAGRGMVSGRRVSEPAERALLALDRPDRELAMRLVTADGVARVTVARRGSVTAWVDRRGDAVAVDLIDGRTELADALGLLMRSLVFSPAAEIVPVGAPLDQFGEALVGTHDATEMADRIRALGADPRAAMLLGSALGARLAFAEIVCHALDVDDNRINRGPAAVAVFYTRRGRIVAAPSASPSGQVWTTFKGGSDHAIKQAISLLVEMSADSWEDSNT
jgi:hypothetical protein